jgi:hypothetical protein
LCNCDLFKFLHLLSRSKVIIGWQKKWNLLFKDHRSNLATTNCISIICWPYINHILIIYRFYFDNILNYNINSKYCKKWRIHYWWIHYVHNNLFVIITMGHSEFTKFFLCNEIGTILLKTLWNSSWTWSHPQRSGWNLEPW